MLLDHPLKFFADFVNLKQLKSLKNDFFCRDMPDFKYPLHADEEYIFDVNPQLEINGNSPIFRHYFSDYLSKMFTEEKNNVILTIDQQLIAGADFANYLDIIESTLFRLIQDIKSYNETHKYPFILDSYLFLRDYINEKKTYLLVDARLSNVKGDPEEALVRDRKASLVNREGLQWTSNSQNNTANLYIGLKAAGFISSDTPLAAFQNLFNPNELKTDEKIIWTKLVKGKLSKILIFTLFDELISRKLIKYIDTSIVYYLVENLFLDQFRCPLKNIRISYQHFMKKGTKTNQDFELEKIISTLQ